MKGTRKLHMNMKRIAAALIALAVLLAPFPACAEASAAEASDDKCGANLTWQLDGGVLRISGTGAMYDYENSESNSAPWRAGEINEVVIDSGVESIGAYAFYNCDGLTEVTIPQGVAAIGMCAFRNCSALEHVVMSEGVESVSDFAFAYCTQLTYVELPKSVMSISATAFKKSDGAVLYVYEGSYAAGFAEENELMYEIIPEQIEPQYKKGDPDGDGQITVSDALSALRVAARIVPETPELIATCDVDGDGTVTVSDALSILRVAARIVDSL